ncbi:unnamed protein product, partial [Tenebrio molitor]
MVFAERTPIIIKGLASGKLVQKNPPLPCPIPVKGPKTLQRHCGERLNEDFYRPKIQIKKHWSFEPDRDGESTIETSRRQRKPRIPPGRRSSQGRPFIFA